MRRSILLGSRVAAVAVCVASSAVTAAPAAADPSGSDRHAGYLFTLERFGLHLSHDDAFAQEVAVCLVLNEPGETLGDVMTQIVGMHPTWNRIDAQHLVGVAEERYCPDKLPRGAHQQAVCGPDETSAAFFETVGLRDGNRRPRSERAARDYEIAGERVDWLVEPRRDAAGQGHPRPAEHPARLRHTHQPGADRTADPPYARYEVF
jgi:Protein of unknown function (DUF732)